MFSKQQVLQEYDGDCIFYWIRKITRVLPYNLQSKAPLDANCKASLPWLAYIQKEKRITECQN